MAKFYIQRVAKSYEISAAYFLMMSSAHQNFMEGQIIPTGTKKVCSIIIFIYRFQQSSSSRIHCIYKLNQLWNNHMSFVIKMCCDMLISFNETDTKNELT